MLDLREALRLKAYTTGRAQPCATVRSQDIRPDAVILSLTAIADEHESLQSFLLDTPGRLLAATPYPATDGVEALGVQRLPLDARGRLPVFHDAQDSRNPRHGRVLLEVLADYLLPVLDGGGHTQLILPTEADWVLLREAVLKARSPGRDFPFPKAERLCRRLLFHVHRAEDIAQQSVVILSRLLRECYVTGGPDVDTQHLGAQLAWFSGRPVTLDDIEQAEKLPAGIRTLPKFDNDVYLDLLADANAAGRQLDRLRRDGASAHEIAAAQAELARALAVSRERLWEQLHHKHEWIRQALLALHRLPVAPSVLPHPSPRGNQRKPTGYGPIEAGLWAEYRDSGNPDWVDLKAADAVCDAWHAARTDPTATVAQQTAAHEAAQAAVNRLGKRAFRHEFEKRLDRAEAVEARRIVEDTYARLAARRNGTVLHGTVVSVTRVSIPHPQGRSSVWTRTTMVVRSDQQHARIKVGRRVNRLAPITTSPNAHEYDQVKWRVAGLATTGTAAAPSVDVTITVDHAKSQPGAVGDEIELLAVPGMARHRRGYHRSPYAARMRPPDGGRIEVLPATSKGPDRPAHLR